MVDANAAVLAIDEASSAALAMKAQTVKGLVYNERDEWAQMTSAEHAAKVVERDCKCTEKEAKEAQRAAKVVEQDRKCVEKEAEE